MHSGQEEGRTSGMYSCAGCDALQSWTLVNFSYSTEHMVSVCECVCKAGISLLIVTVRYSPVELEKHIDAASGVYCVNHAKTDLISQHKAALGSFR